MARKKTGSAIYPHNTKRPTRASILKAIDEGDIETVINKLSPRQQAFCEEYILDYNATQATIRAGYSAKYPDKQAYLNLMHKGIRAYISHLTLSSKAKIVTVTPDYIVQKINEIVQKEGARDGDKLRGLELLAKHLGMFVERTEITGKDGEAIRIERLNEEAAELKKAIDRISRRTDIITVVPNETPE